MRITVVEDDHLQAEYITETLRKVFAADTQLIRTEQEFRARFEDLASHKPDVIVMDVMLRWTDPSPDMEKAPADVKQGGFESAGLRCKELLAKRSETSQIPVILYTVLENRDLREKIDKSPGPVFYLAKQAELNRLVDKIQQLVPAGR